MGQSTIKITLQGDPAEVEAIAEQMKKLFRVSYMSKNARLATNKEHVRRVLRVQPVEMRPVDAR